MAENCHLAAALYQKTERFHTVHNQVFTQIKRQVYIKTLLKVHEFLDISRCQTFEALGTQLSLVILSVTWLITSIADFMQISWFWREKNSSPFQTFFLLARLFSANSRDKTFHSLMSRGQIAPLQIFEGSKIFVLHYHSLSFLSFLFFFFLFIF